MAVSGVDRLLQYARELGVEPARPAERTRETETTKPASRRDDGEGIRLSLSSAATAPHSPVETSETQLADSATLGASESKPVESSPPSEARPDRDASIAPRGSALDAYQRRGTAVLGQRVAIRA